MYFLSLESYYVIVREDTECNLRKYDPKSHYQLYRYHSIFLSTLFKEIDPWPGVTATNTSQRGHLFKCFSHKYIVLIKIFCNPFPVRTPCE